MSCHVSHLEILLAKTRPKTVKNPRSALPSARAIIGLRCEVNLVEAYSIWLSDPQTAAQLIRDHAEAHAARKTEFEQRLEKITTKYGQEIWQPNSKWLAFMPF